MIWRKFIQGWVELQNEASTDETSLDPQIKAALDEALEASHKGQVSSHEDVMQKTREKYSLRLSWAADYCPQ